MPNFTSAFKAEVARLARREVKALTDATRRAAAQHRRDIATLKREVDDLRRRVAFLEGREKPRLVARAQVNGTEEGPSVRFSPKWLHADRKRLGLSAADYGRLVGVTPLTIYNWESGRTKPRARQLAAWGQVRGIGKRDARRRLEVLAD